MADGQATTLGVSERRVVAFDTETGLIRPGLLAPPLVCLTWQRPGCDARIVSGDDARHVIRSWLIDPNTLLVGHNVAYDLGVIGAAHPDLLPLIFDAYAADRVADTKLRQQLLDIAGGVYRGRLVGKGHWIKHEYTLEALAKRKAGMVLQKDAWRLSYAEFLGIPLNRWPEKARELQAKAKEELAAIGDLVVQKVSSEEAKRAEGLRLMVEGDPERCTTYPLDDARATLAVYLAQEEHARFLADQYRQARAAWWLHLASAWGLRTDPAGVEILRRETEAAIAEIEGDLQACGLVRADGSRDTKRAAALMVSVCKRDNLELRRTPSHTEECPPDADCHICLDADACAATEDETLVDYAELSTLKKVLSNDLVVLQTGTTYPVHPRYDLAETGRTTCSRGSSSAPGANIQNLRRKAGIREAFVPRNGRLFAQADYPQLELYTLAQCCKSWVGHSSLGDALNRGLDPHLAVAAVILGISYEEAAKNKKRPDVDAARQTAKVANFGFPGGLGIEKLVLFARKAYKVILTPEDARRLKAQWFEAWPEMRLYFERVNGLVGPDGRANVETLFTQRYRGGATYCAACNNGFQALGSDCAKHAGWLIARAEYVDAASPLYGARTVAFVHDEFIVEVDEPKGHEAAFELARLMVEGANAYLPDVPIPLSKMEPLLMRRWSKKAEAVFVDGRLQPWE